MRNERGVIEGYRETLLYLYMDRSLHANIGIGKTLEYAHKLNDLMHSPMSPSEVEVQCKPASTKLKQNSLTTIIRKLKITVEEQQALKFIVDAEEKDKRRKRLKNRHPLLNRTKKEVDQLYRRRKILHLKAEGHSNSHIARALSVNRSTIKKDLDYIYAHKYEFRKLLQEIYESVIDLLEDKAKYQKFSHDEIKWLLEWTEWATVRIFEDDS